jgi:hypothetical protein
MNNDIKEDGENQSLGGMSQNIYLEKYLESNQKEFLWQITKRQRDFMNLIINLKD